MANPSKNFFYNVYEKGEATKETSKIILNDLHFFELTAVKYQFNTVFKHGGLIATVLGSK